MKESGKENWSKLPATFCNAKEKYEQTRFFEKYRHLIDRHKQSTFGREQAQTAEYSVNSFR